MIVSILKESTRKLIPEYLGLLIIFLAYHFFSNIFFKEYVPAIISGLLVFYFYVRKVIVSKNDKGNNPSIFFNYSLIVVTVFYFTSYYTAPLFLLYYFPVILSTSFLFDIKKDKIYLLGVFVLILASVFINYSTNFRLFSISISDFRLKWINVSTIIETFLFTIITIYFTQKKNIQFQEFYQKLAQSNEFKKITNEKKESIEEDEFVSKTKDEVSFDDVNMLISLINENKEGFLLKFKIYYINFYDNLVKQYTNLVISEIEVCALMKLNMSTKEIARITNSTPRAIESKKYRIRKKIGLDINDDLYIWINKI